MLLLEDTQITRLATGSVVLDAKVVAFASFVGVVIEVYSFDKISMAHFNPAVTLRFLSLDMFQKEFT